MGMMDSFRYILYAYKRTLLRTPVENGKRMETRHRSIRRREISFDELPPLRIGVRGPHAAVVDARVVFAVVGDFIAYMIGVVCAGRLHVFRPLVSGLLGFAGLGR
jgi:hypothetical protein